MIKFLQSGNKAAKYILAGFLLILAGSMVTYLIPGFMGGTTVNEAGVVATVGSHEIRREDVAREVQRQTGGRQVPDFYVTMLRQQALNSLIQQAELLYESDRMGLKVSDQEFRDELQYGSGRGTFFPNGKWIGAEKYKQLVLAQGVESVEKFEHDAMLRMQVGKLFNVITAGASVPESAVEQVYKEQNTKVKFQYAVLTLADITKTIKPTDTELKAYFDANLARYANAIPEKRQVKYFVLNEKEVAAKITVDPAAVQRAYSANQESYRVPERAKVRHILIEAPKPGPDGKVDQKAVDEARAKAQDVLKQVKATGDWTGLAKKYSGDPGSKDKGGELDWIIRGQTVAEFEKTAFSQSKGQISDPVQSSFGFHIIQTEDKEDAHLKPLAEVKAGIEDNLKQDKIKTEMNRLANEAQDVARKQGLDKAAAKYGAHMEESNPIAHGDSLPGIGVQPAVMDMIFATADKAGAQVATTPFSTVVFEVTKVLPARAPALDEVKERVATDFKNERANDILRSKTIKMSDRAHAEHDLAKAAKEFGATFKTSELVARTQTVPDIGNMAGPAGVAFTMKPGEISGPLSVGGGQAVLEIVEKQEPATTDANYAKEKDQLRERLASEKRQELLGLFMNNLSTRLEKEGKVKINKAEMENLTKSRG
jgi:peptidyl-prolyl cis-trans isomerase D